MRILQKMHEKHLITKLNMAPRFVFSRKCRPMGLYRIRDSFYWNQLNECRIDFMGLFI